MKTAEEFYLQRDKRTMQYIGENQVFTREIFISVAPNILQSYQGQILLLSLANMLCRVHRKIAFKLNLADSQKLLIPSLFNNKELIKELFQTMKGADPFGDFYLAEHPDNQAVSIGIGRDHLYSCDYYLGANGALAQLAQSPVDFDTEKISTVRGAALISCLGAAAVFKKCLGIPNKEILISAWNFKEDSEAEIGPDHLLPIEFKNILIVGGGAIGSNMAYWAHNLGQKTNWELIENDIVKIHNLNRSLIFFVEHTSWESENASSKNFIISNLLSSVKSYNNWYHELPIDMNKKFDAVLCLANEYDVRKVINFLDSPLFLQATTGTNWTSQLHRHHVDYDDCVFCRTGEIKEVKFGCSSSEIKLSNQHKSSDAALPFLSALSSLMLVIALQKHQDGSLINHPHNDWRLDLISEQKLAGRGIRKCKSNCDIKYYRSNIKRSDSKNRSLETNQLFTIE